MNSSSNSSSIIDESKNSELSEIQSIINQTCTAEELESAIERCSNAVLESETLSVNRKWFVRFLIELRYKLAELRFNESSNQPMQETVSSFVLFSGHHFYLKKDNFLRNLQCDHCEGIIWCYFQSYYKCSDCGFCCHNLIDELNKTNICPHTILTENGQFSMEICPEIGISTQNYLCADCGFEFDYIDCPKTAPRLCDYDGLYYCRSCHTGEKFLIPARVVNNWDLEFYPVCRKNAQFLRLLADRPVLNFEKLHAGLNNSIEDLKIIQELRLKLISMQMYLSTCKNAQKEQLLKISDSRKHLVESFCLFSLNDLINLKNNILMADLSNLISEFSQHIKINCDICKQKGSYCEICVPQEILYRFDDNVLICEKCDWIYHKTCFQQRNRICPKCQRQKKRTTINELQSEQTE